MREKKVCNSGDRQSMIRATFMDQAMAEQSHDGSFLALVLILTSVIICYLLLAHMASRVKNVSSGFPTV